MRFVCHCRVKSHFRGLTLIELLLTVTLLGILAAVALPGAERTLQISREARLEENLGEIRTAIDRCWMERHRQNPTGDEAGKYPANLDELVRMRLLRRIPRDPFTGKTDWEPVWYVEIPERSGLFDVRSTSRKLSSRGDIYAEW